LDQPAAWLSLDEHDNDVFVFTGFFIAAIRSLFPDASSETLQLLGEGLRPPADYLVAMLINDMAILPAPFVMVLDDYHLLNDEAALALMSGLIDRPPTNLHLVIVSRTDPRLPLARLRARSQIVEIRLPELRFRADEAESFLSKTTTMAVNRETVMALNERIEGWIVGLRLAALTTHGEMDLRRLLKSFQGEPNTFVSDYLITEVLAQLPGAIQAFMSQVSILDRLSGPLCEALTGVDDPVCDGQAYLEWMEERNLFLIPLDDGRKWYRYHHLFKDLLLSRLKADYPAGEIKVLHSRASHWLAGQGYVEEALQHAIAADDIDMAVELVEQSSQNLLNRVERPTLERWLAMLPESVIRQRPQLLVAQGWLFYLQWRLSAVATVLDLAEAKLESDSNSSSKAGYQTLIGQINTLRSGVHYIFYGDPIQALAAGEAALQNLPVEERGARSTALLYWALAQQALGEMDKAVTRSLVVIADPSSFGPSRIQAFTGLALAYFQAAQLEPMGQTLQRFLTHADNRPVVSAIVIVNWLSGFLHYEWDDLETAGAHFSRLLELRYRTNFVGTFNGLIGQIQINQARGHLDQAQENLDDLRMEVHRLDNVDFLPPLKSSQANQWLLQGEKVSALRWARTFAPDGLEEPVVWFEVPSLTRARILTELGTIADVQKVQRDLQKQLAQSEGRHFTQRAIQILAHLALTYDRLGQPSETLATLRRAIILAEPGGYIRSFVDLGPSMARMLISLKEVGVAAQDEALLSSGYLSTLIDAFEPSDKPTTPPYEVVESAELAEPLTRREAQILRLMQEGLTNQEIADTLVISPHTVKTHATNIYRKLDVPGRRYALQKAAQQGLLPAS
jgi:LuxR family maltose regulon positive regulatory protein